MLQSPLRRWPSLFEGVQYSLDRSKYVKVVDREDVEATVLSIQAVLAHPPLAVVFAVAAAIPSEAASPVVERIVKSARLRPAEGTERETAAWAHMIAQPLSALFAVPKSHHLDQEERFANRNRQSLLDTCSMVVPTR